ncbi:hypothetical protein [Streptomyces sp. Inha503]|uniref:hypothetical protein n=1 Tax=Streptomyces sp. Inha503 TaxID=3383314 RepID=UPI0039A35BA0
MDRDRSPFDIAGAASEQIRALNHSTLDGQGYDHPARVTETIGTLSALASRLQLSISQLDTGYAELLDSGRHYLYDPEGETVTEHSTQVHDQFRTAHQAAEHLHEALSAVQNLTALLGYRESK